MSDQGMAMSSDQGELIAQLQALRAENDRLKAKASKRHTLSWKVSEKGAISIYGLGRFPVTLYASQFDRLDQDWEAIREFRKDNNHLLATKD